MKLAIPERELQRFAVTFSELDDAFRDTRKNFLPSPNMRDRQRKKLLKGIDRDLWEINKSVCEIGEKIEQLKSLERTVGRV